jgi:hypothetical protein
VRKLSEQEIKAINQIEQDKDLQEKLRLQREEEEKGW